MTCTIENMQMCRNAILKIKQELGGMHNESGVTT